MSSTTARRLSSNSREESLCTCQPPWSVDGIALGGSIRREFESGVFRLHRRWGRWDSRLSAGGPLVNPSRSLNLQSIWTQLLSRTAAVSRSCVYAKISARAVRNCSSNSSSFRSGASCRNATVRAVLLGSVLRAPAAAVSVWKSHHLEGQAWSSGAPRWRTRGSRAAAADYGTRQTALVRRIVLSGCAACLYPSLRVGYGGPVSRVELITWGPLPPPRGPAWQ